MALKIFGAMRVVLKSLVRENRTQGSVRGAFGNRCLYLVNFSNYKFKYLKKISTIEITESTEKRII